MKVTGTSTLAADRLTVWRALNDPAVLARAIPGCRRLEALGDDVYDMTVAAGVGSIKGVYDGQVRLSDQEEPGSFHLQAQGAGAAGTIGADVLVTLTEAPDGGTSLSYDADATVGGVIGGVGQRMLVGVSKKLASEFFSNVDLAISSVSSADLPDGGGAPEPSGVASLRVPPDPSTVAPPPSVSSAGGPSTSASGLASPSASSPRVGDVFTPTPSSTGRVPDGRGGRAPSVGFAAGVVVGAAAALAGAVVGAWIGRRRD